MKKCKSKWNLKELRKRVYEAVADAGEVNMNKVLTHSAATETPLDTGRLINSGMVKVIAGRKGALNVSHIKIKASYGGSEGLAGRSILATRTSEPLPWYKDKSGKVHLKDKDLGISRQKNTSGQLNYAIWWHEHEAKRFNNGRKSHYLIDPFLEIINQGTFVADIMWSVMQRLEGK